MIPKGTLIAIGGAEDKGLGLEEKYTIDFIEDGILSHVVSRSGGIDARIAVITSASSIPAEVGNKYKRAFWKLGCRHITILDIKDAKSADSRETIEIVRSCDSILLSGGDQRKLSHIFVSSLALQIIQNRYLNEDFVIAGTSAGAVALSDTMIMGGSSSQAMLKGAVKLGKGLNLIKDVIFDSHFIKRGRFGRLTEAVALNSHLLGIGLGEDTGLIIEKGNDFTTIGSGMVLLFDASNLSHNTVRELAEGTPISISNMTIHVLANGDRYFLKQKKVEVLPIEAGFI